MWAGKKARVAGITAAMLFALLFSLAGKAGGAPNPDPVLGKHAPLFTRTDLEHRTVNLAAYRGKVILLNFWATWCGPCQVELPRFAAWQEKYGPRGFQVIAVSMDDEPGPVKSFLDRRPLPFPVLMGDERLGKQYGGILGLPISFLIDRRGVVVKRYKGEPRMDDMDEEIRSLLDAR